MGSTTSYQDAADAVSDVERRVTRSLAAGSGRRGSHLFEALLSGGDDAGGYAARVSRIRSKLVKGTDDFTIRSAAELRRNRPGPAGGVPGPQARHEWVRQVVAEYAPCCATASFAEAARRWLEVLLSTTTDSG